MGIAIEGSKIVGTAIRGSSGFTAGQLRKVLEAVDEDALVLVAGEPLSTVSFDTDDLSRVEIHGARYARRQYRKWVIKRALGKW